LDGDGFILQVQGVFTRIRSGGYPKGFGWRCAWIYYGGSRRWEWIRFKMQAEWLRLKWVKKP
jgi:hypothetical protein